MKVEEIYNILKADNFEGQCVLKTCLSGTLENGEITTKIDTSYFSNIRILDSGLVFIDFIRISKGYLNGLIKDSRHRKGEKRIYQVALEDIKSFKVSSTIDCGKYHRPVYLEINQDV